MFLLPSISMVSCKIDKEELPPQKEFMRIYHDDNYSASYYPVDIETTPDGGYLILASYLANTAGNYAYWNVLVVKTDALGEVQWKVVADDPYRNPVPQLMAINNQYYFFCMDATTLGSYLMSIDVNAATVSLVEAFPQFTYPLAASATPDGGFLLQSYERFSRTTYLSKINNATNVQWSRGFPVIEDTEAKIVYHQTKTGDMYPFFTGSTADGSYYFMNGFANYSLSLNFTDNAGNAKGVLNGFRYDGAVSSCMHLTGNTFALTRYSFGDSYIYPAIELQPNNISHTDNLEGTIDHEIEQNGTFRSMVMTLGGKQLLVFATTSKNKQTMLYFYDMATSKLVYTKYLGGSMPAILADIQQTPDGGIVVLTRTFVAGRFDRMVLFRLNGDEIIK